MQSQGGMTSARERHVIELLDRIRIIEDEAAEAALLDALVRPERPFILSFVNAHAVNLGWNQPGMLDGLLRSLMIDSDELQYAMLATTRFKLSETEVGGYLIVVIGLSSLERISRVMQAEVE